MGRRDQPPPGNIRGPATTGISDPVCNLYRSVMANNFGRRWPESKLLSAIPRGERETGLDFERHPQLGYGLVGGVTRVAGELARRILPR